VHGAIEMLASEMSAELQAQPPEALIGQKRRGRISAL